MRPRRPLTVVLALSMAVGSLPAGALLIGASAGAASAQRAASEPLAEAQSRYDEADFSGALAALEAFDAARGASREELCAALVLRAKAAFALRMIPAATEALRALVVVAPEAPLGSDAPPDLLEIHDAARVARPRLELSLERDPDAPGRVSLRLLDEASLTRSLRLESPGVGELWSGSGSGIAELGGGARAALRGVALGIGGAELVSASLPALGGAAEESARGDVILWGTLGGVGAALVVAAVVAGSLAAADGGTGQLGAPTVAW